MPLPGSNRNPVFLQEIKEAKHEPVQEPVVETSPDTNEDLAILITEAEGLGIAVKSHWAKSQLEMAIRLRRSSK